LIEGNNIKVSPRAPALISKTFKLCVSFCIFLSNVRLESCMAVKVMFCGAGGLVFSR
jgi:hypothetical protein